jgi:hypothetical protein
VLASFGVEGCQKTSNQFGDHHYQNAQSTKIQPVQPGVTQRKEQWGAAFMQ